MQSSATTLTDEKLQEREWLERAKSDPAAFEPIFQKYHDAIFNYALRRLQNLTLAEDITANTFLKALDNLHKFHWQGVALSSWLYRIATNEINLHYRKFKRQVPLTLEHTKALVDERQTDAALLQDEDRAILNGRYKKACRLLAGLKLKYQSVLALRYFEDKPIKEIAEILELSENTVKTRIRRGLIELRKEL